MCEVVFLDIVYHIYHNLKLSIWSKFETYSTLDILSYYNNQQNNKIELQEFVLNNSEVLDYSLLQKFKSVFCSSK